MSDSTATVDSNAALKQLLEEAKTQTELLEQILEVLTDMRDRAGAVMI